MYRPLPRIRPDADWVIRTRLVKFLTAGNIGIRTNGYVALAGMPRLSLNDLTTEALDRLACHEIEEFWRRRRRRAALAWDAASRSRPASEARATEAPVHLTAFGA